VSGGMVIRDALLGGAIAPLLYYLAALVAALRFSARPCRREGNFCPPVSILKPIRGLDRETYENYASFCRQNYPEFEILFCVADTREPAVPVIEKLIQDFPARSIRLLIGSEPLGVSDKVNKLCRLVREARYDIVLISDSDVRIEPGFLGRIVGPFSDAMVGGVTCLYRGLSDGSIAADMEALGNSTDFAPGVLVAWLLGDLDFMLGAVMATTKQQLEKIGGLETLVDHLCDDYELGNRIAKSGHRVELSRCPVSIVYPHQTLSDAFRHQLRWNMTIRCSRPWGHLGLIFSQGLPWACLAAAVAPTWGVAGAYLLAYAILRVGVAWIVAIRLLGDRLAAPPMWMLPLRDAMGFSVWLLSFFPHRIRWRGQEFYIRDKRLVPIPSRQP
jgi:ceramide glucosyltransferase